MVPNLLTAVALKPYTTFHIGGFADYFCSINERAELRPCIQWAKSCGLPIFVLGGGSNVLISDGGIRGLVLHMRYEFQSYDEKRDGVVSVTVGAGVPFDTFVEETVERGLWGLENLSAIPGSVGATPVQNVGAYGREVSELITHVTAYNMERDTFEVFDADACAFGYRNSFFKTDSGKKYVIVDVTFALSKKENPKIHYKDLRTHFKGEAHPSQRSIREAVKKIRSEKFPDWSRVGTAGSFFKNPIIPKSLFEKLQTKYPELPGYSTSADSVKVSLSWILDKVLNSKGARLGNVGMYAEHSLVMVNHGNATAEEIVSFAKKIQRDVFIATQIPIEWEVQYIQ